MRCCAPFCRNAADNVPASREGRRISFHGFPSDARLHAAWLKALGKKGAPLSEPAVVCSQHFLDDDIYETESGSRQIDAAAIPSTVLVCMICMDTDSKMLLMSKDKMEEAYEYLTGYVPCNQGNIKQTLCVQCAQRLKNFSQFRDQSLRARVLMMNLVEKHELITRRHIKMINRTKHRLKSPMVVKILGADFCDLHIQEDTSDDKQTESEATIDTGAVKTEESDDSMVIEEDMDVIYEEDDNADSANNEVNEDDGDADNVNNEIIEDDNNTDNVINDIVTLHNENISDDSIMLDAKLLDDALLRALQKKPEIVDQVARIQDLLKFESEDFKCLLCSEEFVQELVYMEHMSMHATSGSAALPADEGGTTAASDRRVGASPSLLSLAEIKPDTAGPLHMADTAGALHRPDTASALHRPDTAGLHDGRAPADVAHTSVAPLSASVAISNESEEHSTQAADAGPSSESAQGTTIVSGDLDYRSADSDSRTNDSIDRYTNCIVKLYDVFSKKVVPKRDASLTKTRKVFISCDSQEAGRNNMSYESKSKDNKKQFYYSSNSSLVIEDKMYICDFCRVMFKQKSLLVKHIQSHTTVNRFTCEICGFKSKYKNSLTRHMRTHTGEKPYSCKLCEYKAVHKSNLVDHVRNHTGEKPYSCKLCEFKAVRKGHLVVHMRQHTGEKPYSCKLCEYKAAHKSHLEVHMRKHTGEKPFSCELCKYKTTCKTNLVFHKRQHTGEKPYSCEFCKFKTASNGHLVVHKRLHTGEKPYSCKLCEYKAVRKGDLVKHMRKHTGERPYSCKLCEYKAVRKGDLVVHTRKHTGEKPYSCKLCEYKAARTNDLVVHNMRKHSGEKPYNCELCEYKVARKGDLVVHMRKHTGEKPYSCKLCKYKAVRKRDLVIHMKKHTG